MTERKVGLQPPKTDNSIYKAAQREEIARKSAAELWEMSRGDSDGSVRLMHELWRTNREGDVYYLMTVSDKDNSIHWPKSMIVVASERILSHEKPITITRFLNDIMDVKMKAYKNFPLVSSLDKEKKRSIAKFVDNIVMRPATIRANSLIVEKAKNN